MFGDCNTYNSNWRDHPNFSWKPQPPQYKQHVQALPQASSLEQAMVNLSKFVGDFVGAQKSINAQLNQRIDSVESSLIKRMDEVQNDLSQKLDILQDSISRLANLNTMQEKENSPSQPYQNSMSIHEMEAEEGEPSQKREVKEVITLRSEDSHQGRNDETHASIFPQALYGKILQSKSQARDANFIWDPGKLNHRIKFLDDQIKRNCKEIEGSLSEQIGVKTEQKQGKNRAVKPSLAHECHFAAQSPHFATVKCYEVPKRENSQFRSQSSIPQGISQLRGRFWHTSAISQHSDPHFAAAKWLRSPKT
ncbi:hypothetical protein CK203_006322 [Vitis vinifera]|uniref:Uncharacterized protein n=1 Tax=Vitis vinifera TaxID=29760 RepID=A0A438KAJ4_VITVI|nr:hypothetical protein CK203_006322 [Vitis vinifera]